MLTNVVMQETKENSHIIYFSTFAALNTIKHMYLNMNLYLAFKSWLVYSLQLKPLHWLYSKPTVKPYLFFFW